MIFDYPGYDLQFIQKRRIKDGSAHLFSFLYKFYSPVTELQYVLTADYHEGDFFAIKFNAKMHRKSDFKYSLCIKLALPTLAATLAVHVNVPLNLAHSILA